MAKELPAFFSDCIKEFCFELGLEHSFSVLMKVISHVIPATHISLSLVEPATRKTALLLVLNETTMVLPKVAYDDNWIHGLEPYRVEVDSGTNVFLVNDTHDENFWESFQKVDTVHRSLLSMELLHGGELVYYMGLRSVESNVFTEYHAKMLTYLKEPISDLVRELFVNNTKNARVMINAVNVADTSLSMLEQCKGMTMVLHQVKEVAETNAGVLILGESGVGKELVAEAIHENSLRRGRPFVKINCGAIPESLLEAELFGYERGAFTGAVAAHKGYFEQANGGTICLDEIGELSSMAQVKLLRILETHEVQRIGSPKRTLLDFRLIAATNQDLEAMVKEGSFRADLWYRINTYTIKVPSLDRRTGDIPHLARYFCLYCAVELGLDYTPEIELDLMQELISRRWPGNVRQLRNWIERALIRTRAKNSPVLLPPTEDHAWSFENKASFILPIADATSSYTLDELNKRYIQWTLQKCRGRIQGNSGAAKILGIKPTTLRSRMEKLGIPFLGQAE